MKRQALLRNIFSAAGQTVVQTVAFFFLFRFLTERLGIEQVGVWSVILATASAARVSELGLAGGVVRFVATCRAHDDHRGASETLQTAAISLAAILGVVLPLLYPVLSGLLPLVLPLEAVPLGRSVLVYALASIWLGAVASVWQGGLDGCLRSDLRAALMIVSTLAYLGMAFVTVPRYGLVGLAVSQVAQGALQVGLGWVAVRGVIGRMPPVPFVWRRTRFRAILGYGLNVQATAVIMLLFEPTTKVLFARFGGLAAAGQFELAQQLVTRVRAFIVESNRVVVPLMAGTPDDGPQASRLYARNLEYLVFLLTPLFAVLASLVPAVSELWLGRYHSEFVVIGVSLTAAWYVNSVTAPAYFAYLGEGRLRWITLSHVFLGVSNGVLGFVLGTMFGWRGVLGAFVISLAVGSLIPVWTYHREHGLRLQQVLSRADGRLAIVCLVLSALAVGGYSLAIDNGGPWALRAVLLVCTTGVIVFAMWRHPLARSVLDLVRLRPGKAGSEVR